ncbi:MAG TPA: hypothetical protein VK425_09910 [Acidimicrobiales bacterium]|nr:hypothetical protein [Acidimicrobiales bacterium]
MTKAPVVPCTQLAESVVTLSNRLLDNLKEACGSLEDSIVQMEWHVTECPEAPDILGGQALLCQFSELVKMLEDTCPKLEAALEVMRWNDAWRRQVPQEQIAAMRHRADWLQAAGNKQEARLWRWEATRLEREFESQHVGAIAS